MVYLFLFLMYKVAVFLTWFALFDVVLAVRLYCRPEIPALRILVAMVRAPE